MLLSTLTFLIQCASQRLSPWKTTLFSFLHASTQAVQSGRHLFRSTTIPHFRPNDGLSVLALVPEVIRNRNAYEHDVPAINVPPAILIKSLLSIACPIFQKPRGRYDNLSTGCFLGIKVLLCFFRSARLRIVMTTITIRRHTYGIMTFIAKSLSACMTFLTLAQSYFPSVSVTHDLLSDSPEELPVMIAHVFSFLNAFFIFWIGSLQEWLGNLRTLGKDVGKKAISRGK